jgi:hypothetical protein
MAHRSLHLFYGMALIARSKEVMACLPHGSAQKGCAWLSYTVTELSAGLSLSKNSYFVGLEIP